MKTPIFIQRKERMQKRARAVAVARVGDLVDGRVGDIETLAIIYEKGYRAALQDVRKAMMYGHLSRFLRPMR